MPPDHNRAVADEPRTDGDAVYPPDDARKLGWPDGRTGWLRLSRLAIDRGFRQLV